MFNVYRNRKIDWKYVEAHPEFQKLKETQQNPKWHGEGNVFKHTCLVAQEMLDKIYLNDSQVISPLNKELEDISIQQKLIITALMHDLGKGISTFQDEEGNWKSPNHDEESVNLAEKILEDSPAKEGIIKLIKYHMDIMDVKSEEQILEIINDLSGSNFEELLLLKECDLLGAIYDKELKEQQLNQLQELYKLFYDKCAYPLGTPVAIKCLGVYTKKGFEPIEDELYEGIVSSVLATHNNQLIDSYIFPQPITKIINKNTFRTGKKLYKIYERNSEHLADDGKCCRTSKSTSSCKQE